MTLSVCICTWNRSASLAETLLTVAHALDGVEDAQVVVVDNNSDDDTEAVVRRFRPLLAPRYVREPRQGLAFARNAALEHSDGALVAFTDDDTLWRRGAYAALLQAAGDRPEAAFFGGRVLPWWPAGRPPRWLHDPGLDLVAGIIGHYAPFERSHTLGPGDPVPFGANFALRRALVAEIGPFDTGLGAQGARRRRGEDTDLMARALAAGHTGWYEAHALCRHRVDPANLSLRRLFAVGVEKGLALDGAPGTWLARRAAQGLLAVRGAGQLARGRGDRFRQCVMRMGIEQGRLERRRA